jgi:hypothetical protein
MSRERCLVGKEGRWDGVWEVIFEREDFRGRRGVGWVRVACSFRLLTLVFG